MNTTKINLKQNKHNTRDIIFDLFVMKVYEKKMLHLSLDIFVIKILFLLCVGKNYLRKISKSI